MNHEFKNGMSPALAAVEFDSAFYVKLGAGGEWEEECFRLERLKFGWKNQSLSDIRAKRWEKILGELKAEKMGGRGATADRNALQNIVESDSATVWITISNGKLWWTRLADSEVELDADGSSKYRRTIQPWRCKSITGRPLRVTEIPGKISELQRFAGTVCRVDKEKIKTLSAILNGVETDESVGIELARKNLSLATSKAIKGLNWKDFETFVDLVFRAAGWARISVEGGQEKGYDLELLAPVTDDRYLVQVKSRAGARELDDFSNKYCAEKSYRRLYFVVHTPDDRLLARSTNEASGRVEVVCSEKLGEWAIDAGLVNWLYRKSGGAAARLK